MGKSLYLRINIVIRRKKSINGKATMSPRFLSWTLSSYERSIKKAYYTLESHTYTTAAMPFEFRTHKTIEQVKDHETKTSEEGKERQ